MSFNEPFKGVKTIYSRSGHRLVIEPPAVRGAVRYYARICV